MKVLFVLAVVLVASIFAADEEALQKEALEVRNKCLADLKGTEAELKEIEEKHDVSTDFAKKMTLCVFRAYKIMDEKNKFSKDNLIEIAKKVFDGKPNQEEKMKFAQEIADTCDKEVGALEGPAEETAKSLYDCMKKIIIEKKLSDDVVGGVV